MIFDVAVVIPTTLSPVIARAVHSVFEQDYEGSVQILIGIDVPMGSREVLSSLQQDCPERMQLTLIDPGYSTSTRHGGIYPNWSGGALRTIMSYAANSRYLAYLDDDNWWAPSHLRELLQAVRGVDWAFSYRWYVDPDTLDNMAVDEWESVGPGRGIYKTRFNGFVDTNCLLIDKMQCHWVLPSWCVPANRKGAGVDRVMFEKLRSGHSWACTDNATAYYVVRSADVPKIRKLMEKKSSPRN